MKLLLSVLMFVSSYSFSQLEIKANALSALVLIPNIGLEFQTTEKNSFQIDFLGSFWDRINGNNNPLHINQTFFEYRFYKKENISGIFVAPHVGYGMFTLKKPNFAVLYDFWGNNKKSEGSYQSGKVIFYGLTFGFKKRVSNRVALEGFVGGGLTQSTYRGYQNMERTDVTLDNYRHFNKSGEFAAYRGGLMISYSLLPYKPSN